MKFGKGRISSVQSRAQHTFASVPTANIPRSVFNRSHGYKTTFDEGYLVPIYVEKCHIKALSGRFSRFTFNQ